MIPAIHTLKQTFGFATLDLESAAVEQWKIVPAEKVYVPPAKFLPGQLDRIRGTEFGSTQTVVRHLQGRFDVLQGETLGFRLKEVDLVDGVLYNKHTARHLRQRARFLPYYSKPREVASGALYESWSGNRWLGNWLSDDCQAYLLAERFGSPVTTALTAEGHVPDYESRIGMRPRRMAHVRFEELMLFRDSHNSDRKARAEDIRKRLVSAASPKQHAGVFLLRGRTGMPRVLLNEEEIAERLVIERGFRILDPSTASIDEIIDACAGARVVAGVEGSHLVHGLVMMPPDATLLAIQPQERVVSVLKIFTDRQGQSFAFVIASGDAEAFSVSWDELARTLDLVLM